MDTANPSKTTNSGKEGFHGVHLCRRCGWPFPKAIPSARHRRQHKRICGTVPGYTIVHDDSTLQTQYSAVSSFSDDEHGSDGDSNAPGVKSVISVNEGGGGRPLERMNMSADDVFTDAVSEFTDANASLGGDEGLYIDTDTVSHNGFAIPDSTPPVEVVPIIIGGDGQALLDHETSNRSLHEGTAASSNQEKVSSPMTEPSEENRGSNDVEGSDGLENGARMTDDAFEFIAAPIVVPVSNDSSKTVGEERKIIDHTVVESEIGQNEEKCDVKSDSGTIMDNHFEEGNTILRSSDQISGVPVKDIPQFEFDKLLTEKAAEVSASTSPEVIHGRSILECSQVVESGSDIEGDISTSLLIDAGGGIPTAAEIETPETPLVLTGSGNRSEDSNEKDLISLIRASAIDGTGDTSKTNENGQMELIVGNRSIVDPKDGYDKMGIVAKDFLVKVEGNVSENETKSDNLSSNITSSEEHVCISPIVPIQSAVATSEFESLNAERALQLPSDVNTSSGGNATVISKEVKLDNEDSASELKQVSHNILLQKLEEDLSDDEPVESFPATESSSQSLGNNLADDASSKCTGQSQEPEKVAAISVTDAPNEINSPNGSSLDGNWGSVSVLSTMSDAAADVKKMKDSQEGNSSDKNEIFDPPSFLTLIEPQAQKAAITSSASGELRQTPQQLDATKSAWFPSITNSQNDSQGRKKNEEIIAKVTNWSTGGKQHSPLKTLLVEAKANSPNSSDAEPKDKTSVKNGKAGSIVKLDSSGKEWSPAGAGGDTDEVKREKRKVKGGKSNWMPFMCCSSVK